MKFAVENQKTRVPSQQADRRGRLNHDGLILETLRRETRDASHTYISVELRSPRHDGLIMRDNI